MDADVAHAELARPLDERDADVVGHPEAGALRPPLRVGLARDDAEREALHVLDIAGLVGVHAPVQHQALRAFQLLDDVARRRGLLDRERLVLARRGHEGQHHQVGVRIEEDVLDELVGAEATADRRVRPGPWRDRSCVLGNCSGFAPGGRRFGHAPVGFTK